jgi:hypothetical protein
MRMDKTMDKSNFSLMRYGQPWTIWGWSLMRLWITMDNMERSLMGAMDNCGQYGAVINGIMDNHGQYGAVINETVDNVDNMRWSLMGPWTTVDNMERSLMRLWTTMDNIGHSLMDHGQLWTILGGH